MNNLKEMNINLSLQEIKEMKNKKYKEMIKLKCEELAFNYLISKRRVKGKEIIYKNIQMSQYLLPNSELDIRDQKKIFEIRNKMIDISENFSTKSKIEKKCVCGNLENMEHIYYCKYLNNSEIEIEYENIYKGNVRNMKTVMNRFEKNMEKREELRNSSPCGLLVDPLSDMTGMG